jgi:hypothetical protein
MGASSAATSNIDVRTSGSEGAGDAPGGGRGISSRSAARIMGVLILTGWFIYGPGAAITDSLVTDPHILANVAANETTFTVGAVMMLLNSAAVVGIGVIVFPVLKRHSERVALGYLATRILEGAFLAVGVMSLLALTGLTRDSVDGATPARFEHLAAFAVDLNDLSYQTAMATLGLGSVFLCSLLFRTSLLPRPLAAWGVIGYGVFAVGMVLDMFGLGVGTVLTVPGGLFELTFATWLIVKGFNPASTERTATAISNERLGGKTSSGTAAT